jgi:hypothetical protein
VVFDKLYLRPQNETFHEFLENVVIWTLGEEWFKHQIGMEPDKRHQVVQWKYAFHELKKRTMNQQHQVPGTAVYSAEPSGPAAALITFGYDLFCLQQKVALPDFLVTRLRGHKEFQSARYEISAAAITARAGFEIEYLDDKAKSEKHCEFIASSVESGVEFGVEAKSKVRPGVLHEKGNQNDEPNWRGVIDLIRAAKKQKPAGLPFLILVDLNLPPSLGTPPGEKPWVNEGLRRISKALGQPSESNPDPFNLLVITNFSMHYGSAEDHVAPLEWGYHGSDYPESATDPAVLLRILETIRRYGQVPSEV